MRWGAASAKPGALRWVRPLHSHPLHLRAGDRGARDRAISRSTASRSGNVTLRPPLHGAGADQGAAASTTTWRSSRRPRSCSIADRRKEIILADAKNLAFAQGLELVEDEGLLEEVAGLVEWPVVLMGSFEEALPRNPAGGDPHHHPRQPEMLRAARSAGPAQGSPTASSWSPTSRPSDGGTGDRRRQRARRSARASPTPVLLGDRPQDRGSKSRLAEARRASSSTRSSARRASASSASRRWRRSLRRSSAPIRTRPSAPPGSPRPTSLTEMVGEFPELQGLMGRYYAAAAGRGRVGRARDRGSLQAARARPTACRPIRSRSRWRWPTSSTRWSASGRSTRSRPGARTRMRCGGRRWG